MGQTYKSGTYDHSASEPLAIRGMILQVQKKTPSGDVRVETSLVGGFKSLARNGANSPCPFVWQTCFISHFIYIIYGMSSFPLTHIFQGGRSTTNQICWGMNIYFYSSSFRCQGNLGELTRSH